MLIEKTVSDSDRRAGFLGIEAYKVAGGRVLHELLQDDDDSWLEDPALLDRLVTDRHQAEGETIAAKG